MAPDADGRFAWIDPRGPRALSYADADDEAADWAWAHAKRAAVVDFGEIIRVPRFWKVDLPRSFVMCRQNKVLPVSRARLFCRRLGVEPIEIDTSHCPYLSRPDELAASEKIEKNT